MPKRLISCVVLLKPPHVCSCLEKRREKEDLEQKNRQLEEQKKMQEELFREQQKSHDEHIKKLKEKKDEEKTRSREEIMRLERALHEVIYYC